MQNITGYTKVYGIIADPIRHSISPLMHNTAFGALGIDGVYVAFETPEEQFDAGVRGLKALGVQGFNVSMPYKRRIMDYLDEISPAARLAAGGGQRFLPSAGVPRKGSVHGPDEALLRQMLSE